MGARDEGLHLATSSPFASINVDLSPTDPQEIYSLCCVAVRKEGLNIADGSFNALERGQLFASIRSREEDHRRG